MPTVTPLDSSQRQSPRNSPSPPRPSGGEGLPDLALISAAVLVGVAAFGAVLFYMDLPVLAALLGGPAWLAVAGLCGIKLRLRHSLPLVLGMVILGDLALWLHGDMIVHQRLTLAVLTLVALGVGCGTRRWRLAAIANTAQLTQLQWHQSLHQLMLHSTDECVKLIRADGTLLAINPAGVQLLGAENRDELIGRNWFDLWGPAARQAQAAFTEALSSGAAMFEAHAPTLTGQRRRWRNRISTVQEPGGERQLLCISSDISDHAELEKILLRRRRQRLQLADCVAEALLTIDHDWHITSANASARVLFGLDVEVGEYLPSLRQVLPVTPESDLEHSLQQASRSDEVQRCQFYWPERLMWLGATVLPDDDGFSLLLRDLSGAMDAPLHQVALQQLQLTQEITDVGDWLFDYREGLLMLSQRALGVMGLPETTELRGNAEGGHKKAVLEILHPDDRLVLVQAIIGAGKGEHLLELTVRRLDALAPGGVRQVLWRGRSIVDPVSGAQRLLGALRDITHEHALEASAKRNLQLLSSTLDALPMDILVLDSEGVVVSANRGWLEDQANGIRGLNIQVGSNGLELFAKAIQANPDSVARERGRRFYEGERAVIRREIPHFECEYESCGRTFLCNVEPVEGTNLTISAHQDISAIRELNTVIATHDHRLVQAMNATQDGVWVWTPATGSTFYSRQFAQLLQYMVGELPAFDAMLLATTHPDDRARVDVQLAEFSPPVDRQTFTLEVRLLVGSSTFRWFRLRGEVQRRGAGEVEIAGSIMDIQSERDLQQKLYDAAFRDDITLLPNRKALYQQLEQRCAATNAEFVLLLVDLDRFKNVNTTLGVGVGDNLLRQVAQRLEQVVGDIGYVARVSADEFAVLLAATDDQEQMQASITAILDSLKPAFDLDGQAAFITASIGVARCPRDGRVVDKLLGAADAALRSAKQAGRNNYQYFESSRPLPGRDHLTLENELRQALSRNEFELFYQGKFDLHSDELIGAEALLRWRSRERGLVSPAEFIPLLEETGMILPVGEWVLREACRQVCEWHAASGRWLHVAVNVSTIQMTARDFGEVAISILREAAAHGMKIPPQTIELEITESALMADVEKGSQLLKVLKLAGFSIALDDFGTGYSSLGYLRRFSPNTLKMDRSFIADLEQDASAREIAAGIVQLARALSIEVVAEGIETTAQRDILRGMRCPIGQGFLFAKPVPAQEFEQRLIAVKSGRVVNIDKR